ncbi:MAG: hypothetical protein PHH47_01550 [Gallionella sp.]|nr:hypothetical protein [Gallionella sp.]MDD4946730.1 hypothetical protein [Gallionella sp.]
MRNKTHNLLLCLFSLLFMVYPPVASAYIGPGLGAGAVTVVLGIVSGLLMLVVGVVWYPLKKLIRRLKGTSEDKREE